MDSSEKEKNYTIRSAGPEDAEALLRIYSYYVEETAVSFEYETPALDEFKERIRKTLQNYPYLVLEEGGSIRGYAYAGPFHPRKAYERCCELTVYLDKDERRKGYGRALYTELEKELAGRGFLNFYACIAIPVQKDEYLNFDSMNFHERMGYEKIGEFHRCGWKFGRWYNMIWMEKLL